MEDPLEKLIAHPEYSRGYRDGKAFGSYIKVKELRLKPKALRDKEEGVAIMSGNILMNFRFDTVKQAEQYIQHRLLNGRSLSQVNLKIINV